MKICHEHVHRLFNLLIKSWDPSPKSVVPRRLPLLFVKSSLFVHRLCSRSRLEGSGDVMLIAEREILLSYVIWYASLRTASLWWHVPKSASEDLCSLLIVSLGSINAILPNFLCDMIWTILGTNLEFRLYASSGSWQESQFCKYLKRLLPPFYFLKSLNFATQRHRNSVHTHYIIFWLLNFLLLPWVCKNLSQNLDCNTNYCREQVFGEGKPSYFFVDLQNSGDYWKSASIFMRFQRGGCVQLLETEHSDAHEQSYQLDSDLLRHIQSGSFQCMCCQMFALALLY